LRIFGVNATDAESGDGITEFGRAEELSEIELIDALTPRPRGGRRRDALT
jgi:hypothetical protein